jgi:nitric oxide reductase large subunit
MDMLAFVEFVLMLTVIPLMQYSLDNCKQYLEQQREEDQRAIACANMICFGRVLFPQLYFDLSMQYLLGGAVTAGSVDAEYLLGSTGAS